MFQDHLLNVTNFLPDYYSNVGGVTVHGAVVIPNEAAKGILNSGFVSSIAPMPILTAQQAGIPESLRYTQKTDFAPRFGFAWRPFGNDKTVIRGGYGRYIQALLGGLIGAQYGVHTSDYETYIQSIPVGGGVPLLQFPSPFSTGTPGNQDFLQTQQLHYRDPYVQEWNFTIEHDLGFGTALRVSYDGHHATDLSTAIDYNQVPVNTIGIKAARKSRPYPQWNKLQAIANGAWANYNGLTIEALKHLSHGVQFQASYGFARNLSNEAGGGAPNGFVGENGVLVTDRFNLGLDYGNVAFTRRHRFLTSYLYELPFGKGKTFLSTSNGVMDRVVGGWEVAGVLLYQSGPFLTAGLPSYDPSGTNFVGRCGCNARPDVVPGVSPYAATQWTGAWLNPAAFSIPGSTTAVPTPPTNTYIGRFGNAPVGSFVGPGTQAISLSLIKTVKFAESTRLQIGAEASNLFNHANFAAPNTNLNTSSFGKISGLQSAEGAGPRAVQLTARISF
jgi:hypothetical protein